MLLEEMRVTVSPWSVVGLTGLMERTAGSPEVVVGLIDGPVARDHPDLASAGIRELSAGASTEAGGTRDRGAAGLARMHGTYVAGILSAKRGGIAPAICPGCTLLVRSIFLETGPADDAELPSASPDELAEAIVECVGAGARVVNLSVGRGLAAVAEQGAGAGRGARSRRAAGRDRRRRRGQPGNRRQLRDHSAPVGDPGLDTDQR